MPRHHRLGLYDNQGLDPTGPQPTEHNPEQTIDATHLGTGLLPLEHGQLLAKSDGFQGEFVTCQEEGPNVRDHNQSKDSHQSDHSGRLSAKKDLAATA